MRASTVILVCAAILACGPAPAAERLPAHITFLTDGMAAPYYSARRFTQLVNLCATRFSKECRDDDMRPEDLESVNAAVFDRVQVLGPSPQTPLRVDDWPQWVREISRTRDDFMQAYLHYETNLFPRIGAIYAMCPGPDAKRVGEMLDTLRLVNFGRYWQLSKREYERTLASINDAQTALLQQIRGHWSAADCVSAREFAFDLVRLFSSKLRPLLHDDWVKAGTGERSAIGVTSVWYFGMRAEGVLHPEAFRDALDNGPK